MVLLVNWIGRMSCYSVAGGEVADLRSSCCRVGSSGVASCLLEIRELVSKGSLVWCSKMIMRLVVTSWCWW